MLFNTRELTKKRWAEDQYWIIKSPDLIRCDTNSSVAELLADSEIDQHVTAPDTYRLGVYFEHLWQAIIATNADIEVIEHNAQVIIDKQTYGEFDSLLFNKSHSEILHCELAVKFYLQIGHGKQLSDWVGPNVKDRFDSKYLRLFEHQLALGNHHHVKKWLEDKKLSIDRVKLLTRGRLFYSWENVIQQKFDFPPQVSTRHEKGFWITYEQFLTPEVYSAYDWYLLPKSWWLAKVSVEDAQLLVPIHQLKKMDRVQQVVAFTQEPCGKSMSTKEVMRGFIVTNEWLEKATLRIGQ